ncbi:general substrate transporter [Aspergillus pseudonomiae]|uniref:Quinate transporter n=1 Tax=Aspergillus pseudonomiae TaxID=1506151 RepID=A0A5N7DAY4_9EURO|nr:general substrate transporter [Aspergillus pseudonomiae]KAB8261836.1 general substrate transporter [Aspergillus pseudonomiae]KAE8403315.1 general substrate transporter [Aspergillus pseudonomiae]
MRNLLDRRPGGPGSGNAGKVLTIRVYFLAIVTSMGAFLFGYDMAFIGTSIELHSFKKDFGLEHASKSAEDAFAANIVSLLQAGCFFGSLISAPLSDRFGRKLALALAGLTFCVGTAMQVASLRREAVMFVGRFVCGLAVGAASMLVPLYTAECSPPQIRGRLVGIFEIGVQVGMCIGFWINYAVDQTMAPSTSQWLTPFAIQFVPGGLLTIGLLFLPESPRWIARVRGQSLARQSLSYLRGLPETHPSVESELNDIIAQLEDERANNPGKGLWVEIKELTHPGIRDRLFLGFMIMVFFQMAGSNAINHYSPRIFRSIGLTGSKTALISTGLYGVVRLVAVCIAMYWIVDRFGRTRMLIYGTALMAFCMWFIGAFVKLHATTHHADADGHISAGSYATAVFIFVYAVGFCFSWAGVPWIICSEIYPLRVRSRCVAICAATHWLLNFVIARSVPYMIRNIKYGTYFFFASCLTLAIPFVGLMVPETKGLKLEEVDNVFQHRTFWGRQKPELPHRTHAIPCSVDAEKAETGKVEDVKGAGVKEVERTDTLEKYWLNTLPD